MFGNLGFTEALTIFVVALIVFGPRRLPEIARSLGQSLGQFRRAAQDLRTTVEREVAADQVRASIDDVRSLTRPPATRSPATRSPATETTPAPSAEPAAEPAGRREPAD